MSQPTADARQFGERVRVIATAVRVIGLQGDRTWTFDVQKAIRNRGRHAALYGIEREPSGGQTVFRRSLGHWVSDTWPGLPVPIEWAAPKRPDRYVLDPTHAREKGKAQEQHARVRRFEQPDRPEGIVIGAAVRVEGMRYEGGGGPDEDWTAWLEAERRVPLVEVVLVPAGRLKLATIVLAHANDLVSL